MPQNEQITTNEQKWHQLDAFISQCEAEPYPETHLIAILHRVQELYGYLDGNVLSAIGRRLGIPLARIWGVATFYHYFNLTPRGRYVISVCQGTACYVKGAQKIVQTLKDELKIGVGETTADMLFTLLETRCLGACGLAPAMMINNRIYGELTPAKVIEILKKLRAEAQKKGR